MILVITTYQAILLDPIHQGPNLEYTHTQIFNLVTKWRLRK